MVTYPTDPYLKIQFNMENAHNVYKLGHSQIINKLADPPLDDLDNFLGYCRTWAISIVGHHDSEEAITFPFLNQKLDFSAEKEQHVGVAEGLTRIISWIDDARADHAKFKAEELKTMMEEFKERLFYHLDEEVAHLAPENLKVFTPEELAQHNKELMVFVRAQGNGNLVVPFLRSHTPPELKEIWPPFPWIMKRIIIPYMLSWKYSGYWKYSPYDVY